MKIDDVKKNVCEPKITTPSSYWDGYVYTFYEKIIVIIYI